MAIPKLDLARSFIRPHLCAIARWCSRSTHCSNTPEGPWGSCWDHRHDRYALNSCSTNRRANPAICNGCRTGCCSSSRMARGHSSSVRKAPAWALTIHSSRSRFAARLNSGVVPAKSKTCGGTISHATPLAALRFLWSRACQASACGRCAGPVRAGRPEHPAALSCRRSSRRGLLFLAANRGAPGHDGSAGTGSAGTSPACARAPGPQGFC